MNLSELASEQSLQYQSIQNETGQTVAVVLLPAQLEKLLKTVAHLTKQVEVLETFTTQNAPNEKPAPVSTELAEQTRGLVKQHYDLLTEILRNLHQYKQVDTELDRKIYLQRAIADVETGIQEARVHLGELKKGAKPGTLYKVPQLPAYLVNNTSLFADLKKQLLAELKGEQRPPLLLEAPSGTGKSIIAMTLAHDKDIRQAFPDGIFWVRLGQAPPLLDDQIMLIRVLDPTIKGIADIEEGTQYIKTLCETRACLLILDDVWDAQDILTFNIASENSQLLMTTCDLNLLDIIKYFIPATKRYAVKTFSEAQAMDFFKAHIGTQQAKPSTIEAFTQACHYTPLTLKLMAGMMRERPPAQWADLQETLQEETAPLSDKYPPTLMQALQINVDALGEEADYYLALAVFSDYMRIPQAPVTMLWRYLYQLNEEQAQAFIDRLASKGLLHLSDTAYISLHAFQHEYLCAEAELDKLHNHLLAAYRRYCGQHGWLSGPNEGYFFENLGVHLVQAGRSQELKLLLLDFDWIDKKLQATTLHTLLADYELLENKDTDLIKKTLYEAAPILINNKGQLATQLLDRLWGETNLKENKDIQALLHQAKEASPHWQWQPHFPE